MGALPSSWSATDLLFPRQKLFLICTLVVNLLEEGFGSKHVRCMYFHDLLVYFHPNLVLFEVCPGCGGRILIKNLRPIMRWACNPRTPIDGRIKGGMTVRNLGGTN
jgi:hypothetical protein